jgi:hypothetical protein
MLSRGQRMVLVSADKNVSMLKQHTGTAVDVNSNVLHKRSSKENYAATRKKGC